jgi:hypothetical protein
MPPSAACPSSTQFPRFRNLLFLAEAPLNTFTNSRSDARLEVWLHVLVQPTLLLHLGGW